MSEMGKSAKRLGHVNPNDLRRAPAMPDRAMDKKPRRKVDKPWGYKYWTNPRWMFGQRQGFAWFKTETARDQSMKKLMRENSGEDPFYTFIRPIDPPQSDRGTQP